MTRKPPTPIGKDFNPGGARWCTEHPGYGTHGQGRLECTKQRSRGRGVCHGSALRGTDSCKFHAGMTMQVALAKGEAKISAWSAIGNATETVDYRMAVLGVLQMSWLRLAAYSELLRRQVVIEGAEAIQGEYDPENVQSNGLIGHRYGAAGKDGNIFAQSEEIRGLVNLEGLERDRVVKYAKTAHDMGISDRLTSLAERWGDVVATRITLMLDALELSPEQEAKVPVLIQAHLGSIDIGSMGGGDGKP
jgi:hypothetical protein